MTTKRSTSISLKNEAIKLGGKLAELNSRSFSGQLEALIFAEAERRGIATLPHPAIKRAKKAAAKRAPIYGRN